MAKRTNNISKSKKSIQANFKQLESSKKKLQIRLHTLWNKTVRTVDRKPLLSFFTILFLLFVLIFIGSLLRKPQPEKTTTPPTKEVQTYSIGSAPTIKVQAQVEKSGLVKIVALTPGVVSYINFTEGQQVAKGQVIAGLATNYQGGNAISIQREIAAATNKTTKETFDLQMDLLKKQRDIANRSNENANELREITADSLDETRSLLDLNQNIVSTLNTTLANLEADNATGENDATILQTKQLISQFQSGVNQLRSAVRSIEYQSATDKPAADLTTLSKDIALRQLDLQEKSLNLSLETSGLSLKLAQIQEETMYPSSPISGVVERVYVSQFQTVNPGDPIMLIHGTQTLQVVAKVPRDVAQKISPIEMSNITIGSKTYKTAPSYISNEATDGSLYSIIFSIPDDYQNTVSDNEYISIEIPVGYAATSTAVPFVPLDAIYQSATNAYVFVNQNGIAKAKSVELGSVVGQFAEIRSGLSRGDQIILSRTVISGDKIATR